MTCTSPRRASGSERVDELNASLKGKVFVKLPKDLNSEGFQPGEIREILKLIYGTIQVRRLGTIS